ncbi:hypothetical protein BC749_102872 [Flavobacterium araucananum]|nr:hypothetical protein [Flavobacterium araucananum]PWK01296.1 hypothetical protein BC749_102872 [Flavobacterium araucananum]
MSENTKIIQCFLPAMAAGRYTVAVNQQLIKDKLKKGKTTLQDITKIKDKLEKKETTLQVITKKFDFGVDAARFSLGASAIYSVFPPANKSGNYSEALPHIIFSRRTLPWERTLDGKIPVFQREETDAGKRNPQDSPPVPWMALLLFTEDEMTKLQINKNTIAGILQPNVADGVIRPEIFSYGTTTKDVLKLMSWEKPTDGCFTIDVTKEQFEKNIPSVKSLSFLAHAKEVSIAHKDKEGIDDINSEGKGLFSVLVGNRLPAKGKNHTAIVVSLEGYTNYLKDPVALKTIPEGSKARLVVLASWNFIESGTSGFLELVNGVETKSMKIDRKDEAKELLPYFDSGYAPLEHLTRAGAKTISWYHGPFVPKMFPATSRSISFSTADAALRYDRETGFFDISFAAAWQLGRMLALQNQEFSKAILNWRIAQYELESSNLRNKVLSTILEDSSKTDLKDKVIGYLGALHKVKIGTVTQKTPDLSTDIPAAVKRFLGALYKLNGIPFSYLVPHHYLLEKQHTKGSKEYSGTLSFFYVDPNWIEALLDGALSIGRVNKNDTLLELAISGKFIEDYTPQTTTSPTKAKGKTPTEEKEERKLNTTGFLFRSDLISGWRGIEIQAFDDQEKLLPALRFERIDADIFLGIFNGNISKIIITQPYEGLQFGIKRDKNTYSKNLKNEDGTNQKISDGTADVNKELNDGLIENNIIDIAKLAGIMHEKLKNKKWMNTEGESRGEYFTSAEFAFQMVDSPVKRIIDVVINKSKNE